MPKFSTSSLAKLETCDSRLQDVFNEVVKIFDCTIIEGHRDQGKQHLYYLQRKSKLDWPFGKHNSIPSRAVDVMPYPIDWKDTKRMCYFAGFVMATARMKGIRLRWGHDWDGDTDLNDQTFNDGPHYELIQSE